MFRINGFRRFFMGAASLGFPSIAWGMPVNGNGNMGELLPGCPELKTILIVSGIIIIALGAAALQGKFSRRWRILCVVLMVMAILFACMRYSTYVLYGSCR